MTSTFARFAGVRILLGVALCLSLLQGATAQEFPNAPIRFFVPYNAGGANDIAARRFQKIAAEDDVNIIVENLPGASGTVGLSRVARSNPDGYTIGMGTSTTLSNMALGLTNLRREEFVPITQISVDPLLLVVPGKSPIRSIDDFLAAVKKGNGKFSIGSPGINNMNHIFGVLAGRLAGTDVTIVPYPGGAKVQIDLAGGHLEAAVAKPSESKSNIDAGLVRPIAVFANERIAAFADVPTFKEKGYDVFPYGPLVQMSYIVAPRGLPSGVRDWLIKASRKVVHSPEYRQFLADSGLTVDDVSGESLGKLEGDVSSSLKRVASEVLKDTPR